ncbi:MAG: nucleotidyltransferase domain-containing protein [Anaerolineae bacterium]|jgi:predicted nucleotidyltransferase|nr:nucleotidyltransferase domain-containing protein [Anaerolineae bacterium]MDH7474554.1 nucleotidyltransferase domain-containing protein [Anaerolineae bacterium]
MIDLKAQLPKLREFFASQPEVALAYLYGSYARGRVWAKSDLDIGVLFDEGVPPRQQWQLAVRYAADLYRLLDGQVEVDVRELNPGPVEFLYQVIKHRQCLYVRNGKQRVRFEADVISRYLDFKPVLDLYYGHMLAHTKEGDILYGLRFKRRLAAFEQTTGSTGGA